MTFSDASDFLQIIINIEKEDKLDSRCPERHRDMNSLEKRCYYLTPIVLFFKEVDSK